ncbi:MAG: hypothetical protein GEU28_11245 [Dehalococcoidia bacterium]|nr:hypothetical protein [Dehalococcoidia bacterium]
MGTELEPGDLRLAVVGSGRSGTNWLMLVLGHLFDAYPFGVLDWDTAAGRFQEPPASSAFARLRRRLHPHNYSTWEGLWSILPERFILHAHWVASPPVVAAVESNHVRVITMVRHPFEVMLSHLAWVNRSRGDIGLPFLKGITPRSRAFIDFASGPIGKQFMSVTTSWWVRPDTLRVKYEEMVEDPGAVGQTLIEQLGDEPRTSVAEALDAGSAERLRPTKSGALGGLLSDRRYAALLAPWGPFFRRAAAPAVRANLRGRNYYWQGSPGLWRRLLPEAEAKEIAAGQHDVMTFFGYECDFDPDLTADQADANWRELLAGNPR